MRQVKIVKSEIRVSRLGDGRLFVDHRVMAVLPGCRKTQLLSISPSANAIWLKPLFSYNGEANVSPVAWADLVQKSPVVPDPLFPIEVTQAVINEAHEQAASISTCPAVTDLTEVRQEYLDSMVHDRIS